MSSLALPIAFVTTEQGITVFGADNLITPLQAADDEKFLRVNLAPAVLQGVIRVYFAYDNSLPLGSTVSTITITIRLAGNYTASTVACDGFLAAGAEFANATVPTPVLLTSGTDLPGAANWIEASQALVSELSGDWDVAGLGAATYEFSYAVANGGQGALQYLDYIAATANFTLPTPGTLSTTPFATDVARNSFTANAGFSITSAEVTPSYPVTTYFEYTETDPDLVGNGDAGQFEVFRTAETVWTTALDPEFASRVPATISAQVPFNFSPYYPTRTLLPNKTYWFRAVATNGDETKVVLSDWASTTTLSFDPPVGY